MRSKITAFIVATALLPASMSAFADVPCEAYAPSDPVALASPRLDEISGLARGRVNDGVFWAHTDSGGKPELYAIDASGAFLRAVRVKGVKNVDWEDIASGPCDADSLDSACLYIADTGDNLNKRTNKKIIVVRETKLPETTDKAIQFDVVRTIPVQFPEQPDSVAARFRNPDCETIMVDPRDASIYLVSKQIRGGAQTLYKVETTTKKKKTTSKLVPLNSYTFTSVLGKLQPIFNAVTGADFAADGSRFLVRTYAKIYEYDVSQMTVSEAFAHPTSETAAGEVQGESVAYAFNGNDFVTVSEKYKDVAPKPLMRTFSCQTRQVGEVDRPEALHEDPVAN